MFERGRPTPRPHGANRLLWQVDYIYDVLLKDVAVARENLEVRTRRQHPCTRCPPPALLPPARREPLTLSPRRRPDCIRSPSARTFSRPTPSTSSTRTWPRQKHWRSWPRHCRREAEALADLLRRSCQLQHTLTRTRPRRLRRGHCNLHRNLHRNLRPRPSARPPYRPPRAPVLNPCHATPPRCSLQPPLRRPPAPTAHSPHARCALTARSLRKHRREQMLRKTHKTGTHC